MIRVAILSTILGIFSGCSQKVQTDDAILRILYYKDVAGTPELWEIHWDYLRQQDPSEQGPPFTVSSPFSEDDKKRFRRAFEALQIDSLETYYKGDDAEGAPGIVLEFYPTSPKKKVVQLRAYRHEELLHLLKVVNDLSAFKCDYTEDLERREKDKR